MSKCDRCKKPTSATIMSMFNTQNLCLSCKDEEEKDPRYEAAREAEMNAIKAGDLNFKGIGW